MRHNRCVCRRRRILVAAGSDPKPGWDGPGPAFHFKVVAPENRTDGRYGWSGQAPALVGATQTQWDPTTTPASVTVRDGSEQQSVEGSQPGEHSLPPVPPAPPSPPELPACPPVPPAGRGGCVQQRRALEVMTRETCLLSTP